MKKILILIIILLFLYVFSIHTANASIKIDSLKSLITNETNNKEKIKLILIITSYDTNTSTKLHYKNQLQDLASSALIVLDASELINIAKFYLSLKDFEDASNYFQKALNFAIRIKDKQFIANITPFLLQCDFKNKDFIKIPSHYFYFLIYSNKKTDLHLLLTCFLLGIFVFTFLNNLFTYYFVKDKSIRYFILTMVFYLLFYIINVIKYTFEFRLELYGLLIIDNIIYYYVSFNYLRFIHNFLLETGKPIFTSTGNKIFSKRLGRIFVSILILILIMALIKPPFETTIGAFILQGYSYIFLGLIANLIYLFFKNKYYVKNEIRFIALAQVVLAIGVLASNIYAYYFGHRNFISEISICSYFAILSVSIADKINFLKIQKEQAQANALVFLEARVSERTEELVYQKKRSDDLLLNILPNEVAEELKENGKAKAKQFDNVTVLFTDFKGFTTVAEKFTPQELVNELDICFKAFDDIINKFGIEKIKTIGDAYMAVCGLPIEEPSHAEKMISAAKEILHFMEQRKKTVGTTTFEIRIGLNSGSVVAGIVGSKKFAYDIWGDTVNIAARMEQNSEAGKINISETTYFYVKDKLNCTYRGEILAKNKGALKMYFVD